jgi:phosphate acyltransferase
MTARIVVDAMGGDTGPAEPVAGALLAARKLRVDVILVGQEEAIHAEMEGKEGADRVRVVHAPEAIEMHEHPTDAVRGKPESSINVGLRMVKEGEADGFVTAGNTGATMAAALLRLGRIRGIGRPALAVVIPTSGEGPAMLLDVGANAENRPIHLVQWAHMASRYMAATYRLERPRVGLLSIGEEASKGNDLVLEVNETLAASDLNFVGNVEGHTVTTGIADVVVTDGFTGNVALKTAEGVSEFIFQELRNVIGSKPWARLAGLVLLPELRKARRRLDYSEFGGAQLLGVDGVTVIGHGRSNARAIANAIRAARDAVDNGVVEQMRTVANEVPAKARKGGGDEDDGDE